MIRRVRDVHRDDRGAALIESLVATALLGTALVGLMGSFSTLALASRDAERVAAAQGVARSQAARIKAAPYQPAGDYSAFYDPLPAGLTRSAATTWWTGGGWSTTPNGNGLQRITLTILSDGSTAAAIDLVKADR